MKKKACPVGLICIETKYLIVLLCIFILILLYFLLNPSNNDNKYLHPPIIPSPMYSNYKSEPCSEKKFLKSNNNQNEIEDIDNSKDLNDDDNLEINNTKLENNKNIIIKVETPQSNHSNYTHLINKDYERIINPLLPPERRNHYIDKSAYGISNGVPINIPTRGYHGGAMQIGALYKQETSDDDSKIGQNNEPVIIPLFGNPTYNGSNKWMYYTSTDKFNQVKLPISNKNRQCNSEYGCDELYEGDIVQVPAYNGDFKVVKYEYDKPRYIPNIY